MSDATLMLIIFGIWLATGVVLALAMGRRGHDPLSWGVGGTLLGPVGAALAVLVRRDELATSALRRHPLTAHRGRSTSWSAWMGLVLPRPQLLQPYGFWDHASDV